MSDHRSGSVRIEDRVFKEGRLSIGLTLPLIEDGDYVVDFGRQIELAELADSLGFSALWVRDVPLNNSEYPDKVGHLDPWVFLGALASHTKSIALISGAVVLTLRHPLHIAKGAVSVSALSNQRFILGLGSGDRPPEYGAFGEDVADRKLLFSRNWDTVSRALAGEVVGSQGSLSPNTTPFFLLPGIKTPIPMLAVGSGGQSVDWIARNSIGWMTYHREPVAQHARYEMWRGAVDRRVEGEFRAFGVAMKLDLSERVDEPPTEVPLGYRTGREGLIEILMKARESGTHHVSFNLAESRRPPADVIAELAEYVLPHFPQVE